MKKLGKLLVASAFLLLVTGCSNSAAQSDKEAASR